MKKIKNILIIVLSALAFTACENNITNGANDTVYTNTEQVTVRFTDANDNISVLEDGGTVTYDVEFSKPLEHDANISLGFTSSDGSIETTPGITEVSSPTIFVPAGANTASFQVTFSDDTLPDNAETYTVFVGNIIFNIPLSGQYITVTSSPEDSKRTINVLDAVPVVVITTPSDVDLNFSWVGGSDLDCAIRDSSGNVVDYGGTVTPGETVNILQNAADDTYVFSILPWTVVSNSISFSLDFVSPAGTETFDGTLINATGQSGFQYTMEASFLQIDKVTNGSQVTYTLTKI